VGGGGGAGGRWEGAQRDGGWDGDIADVMTEITSYQSFNE